MLFPVDEEIQHIVPLPTNLQPSLNPIQRSRLEKLGILQLLEEVLPPLSFRAPLVEFVENVVLQLYPLIRVNPPTYLGSDAKY